MTHVLCTPRGGGTSRSSHFRIACPLSTLPGRGCCVGRAIWRPSSRSSSFPRTGRWGPSHFLPATRRSRRATQGVCSFLAANGRASAARCTHSSRRRARALWQWLSKRRVRRARRPRRGRRPPSPLSVKKTSKRHSSSLVDLRSTLAASTTRGSAWSRSIP